MKEGLWAESNASGWREAESKASGRSGRQDQASGWMGRVSGESVKKGGASKRMGRLSIPGQTEQDEPTGAMSRNGKPPADRECTNCPATRPCIDPVVRGGATKRRRHPNQALWLGPGQHTAQP